MTESDRILLKGALALLRSTITIATQGLLAIG